MPIIINICMGLLSWLRGGAQELHAPPEGKGGGGAPKRGDGSAKPAGEKPAGKGGGTPKARQGRRPGKAQRDAEKAARGEMSGGSGGGETAAEEVVALTSSAVGGVPERATTNEHALVPSAFSSDTAEVLDLFAQLEEEAERASEEAKPKEDFERQMRVREVAVRRVAELEKGGKEFYEKVHARSLHTLQQERAQLLQSPDDAFVSAKHTEIRTLEAQMARGKQRVQEQEEALPSLVRDTDRKEATKLIGNFRRAIELAESVIAAKSEEISKHLGTRLEKIDEAIVEHQAKVLGHYERSLNRFKDLLSKIDQDPDFVKYVGDLKAAEEAREAAEKEKAKEAKRALQAQKAGAERAAWNERANRFAADVTAIADRCRNADEYWARLMTPELVASCGKNGVTLNTLKPTLAEKAYRAAQAKDDRAIQAHVDTHRKSGKKGLPPPYKGPREAGAFMDSLRDTVVTLMKEKKIGIPELQRLVPWVGDFKVSARYNRLTGDEGKYLIRDGVEYGNRKPVNSIEAAMPPMVDPDEDANRTIRERAITLAEARKDALRQLEFLGTLFGSEMDTVVLVPGRNVMYGNKEVWEDPVIDVVGGLAEFLPPEARPKRPEQKRDNKPKGGGGSSGRPSGGSGMPTPPPPAQGRPAGGAPETLVPTIPRPAQPSKGGGQEGGKGKENDRAARSGSGAGGEENSGKVFDKKAAMGSSGAAKPKVEAKRTSGNIDWNSIGVGESFSPQVRMWKSVGGDRLYRWQKGDAMIAFRMVPPKEAGEPFEYIVIEKTGGLENIDIGAHSAWKPGTRISVDKIRERLGDTAKGIKQALEVRAAQVAQKPAPTPVLHQGRVDDFASLLEVGIQVEPGSGRVLPVKGEEGDDGALRITDPDLQPVAPHVSVPTGISIEDRVSEPLPDDMLGSIGDDALVVEGGELPAKKPNKAKKKKT